MAKLGKLEQELFDLLADVMNKLKDHEKRIIKLEKELEKWQTKKKEK